MQAWQDFVMTANSNKTSRLVFDQKQRVAQFVADELEHFSGFGEYYAMGIECEGEIVSGIVFTQMNDSNAFAHIASTRMTRLFPQLIWHAQHYAFERCGLKRLTGTVESENFKALALDKHIGFIQEAVLEKAGSNGQDMIYLVLWPENFYQRKHDGKEERTRTRLHAGS